MSEKPRDPYSPEEIRRTRDKALEAYTGQMVTAHKGEQSGKDPDVGYWCISNSESTFNLYRVDVQYLDELVNTSSYAFIDTENGALTKQNIMEGMVVNLQEIERGQLLTAAENGRLYECDWIS